MLCLVQMLTLFILVVAFDLAAVQGLQHKNKQSGKLAVLNGQ